MFDFPFDEASVWTSLYCLCYFIVLLTNNYKAGLYDFSSSKTIAHKWTLFFIGLFFVTHTMRGDFFHMMEHVKNYRFAVGAYNYGEPVYIAIAQLVDKNYFLFRTIVWGSAFILFCLTAKRMKVPVYQAAIFLLLNYAILFGYGRVTLAMAVYFLGLSFLCRPIERYPLISYLIGILIVLISSSFHSSSYVMIAMTLLLLLPIRKWTIVLVVVSFPILIYVARPIFEYVMLASTDEMMLNKASNYLERERGIRGLSGILISSLQYAAFYVPFFISTIVFLQKKHFEHISIWIKRLYKVTFGLMLSATCFSFMGDNFNIFFYRVLFMSMIPLALIVTYLYQNGFMPKKQMKIVAFTGVVFISIRYIYDVYVAIVHGMY